MQTRLFRTLGSWAMLGDTDARARRSSALGEPGEALPARAARPRPHPVRPRAGDARRPAHPDHPRLLRGAAAPLSAGGRASRRGFAVLEDRQARALREEVLDALAEARPELIGGAGRAALPATTPIGCSWRSPSTAPPSPRRSIRDRLALGSAIDARPHRRRARRRGCCPQAELAMLAPGARRARGDQRPARPGRRDRCSRRRWRPRPEAAAAGLEAALLTRSGASPCTARRDFPVDAACARPSPALMAVLDALAGPGRGGAARAARPARAASARRRSHRFARAWLAAFDARKRALGLARLRRHDRPHRGAARPPPAIAAWVLWRLDGGLDHVLVDEAQDTSPAQWRVIEAISAEFFAGDGARAVSAHHLRRRRREAVDLQLPGRRSGRVRRRTAPTSSGCSASSDSELQRCDLLYSFRSAQPILALVDAVFGGPAGHGPARPASPIMPIDGGGAGAGRALAVPGQARRRSTRARGTSRSTPAARRPGHRARPAHRRADRRMARAAASRCRRRTAAGRSAPAT